MDRTVAEIIAFLHAPTAADITIAEALRVALTPKARIAYEQMRARGELKQYTATYQQHSTMITPSQRSALKRAGASEP
jgi:hypothetical protein